MILFVGMSFTESLISSFISILIGGGLFSIAFFIFLRKKIRRIIERIYQRLKSIESVISSEKIQIKETLTTVENVIYKMGEIRVDVRQMYHDFLLSEYSYMRARFYELSGCLPDMLSFNRKEVENIDILLFYVRKIHELEQKILEADFIELNPMDKTEIKLGVFYYLIGDVRRACSIFDRLRSAKELDMALIYTNLGLCYYSMGEKKTGRDYIEMAREISPGSIEIYILLGAIYMDNKEIDKAISVLEDGLSIKENEIILTELAKAYIHKDMEKSLEIAKRALRYNDRYAFAWVALAKAIGESNMEMAESCLKIAASIQPKNIEILSSLRDFYIDNHRHESAIEIHKTILKIDKNNHWDREIECYREILEKNAGNPYLWYGLGCAYVKKGDYKEAEVCFQNALDIKADFFEAKYNLAICRYLQQDYCESLNILKDLGIENKNKTLKIKKSIEYIKNKIDESISV